MSSAKSLLRVSSVAGVSMLAACADLRELKKDDSPKLIDLITNIECDLGEGISRLRTKGFSDIDNWTATIVINLQVDATDKGEIALSVEPPVHWGSLNLGLGGSFSRTTSSVRSFEYPLKLQALGLSSCVRDVKDQVHLAGSTGTGLWLYSVLFSMAVTETDAEREKNDKGADPSPFAQAFTEPTSVITKINFKIQETSNANPVFSIVDVGVNNTIGGNVKGSLDHAFTNSIVVTVTPPKTEAVAAGSKVAATAGPRRSRPEAAKPAPSEGKSVRGLVDPGDLRVNQDAQSRFILQQILPSLPQ